MQDLSLGTVIPCHASTLLKYFVMKTKQRETSKIPNPLSFF